MKLIKLKIGEGGYKSLQSGFEMNFHNLDELLFGNHYNPFCFVGLNGSGKSNVFEALSAIFYHLEFLVANFKPESFIKHFSRSNNYPDAYELEYLIGKRGSLSGVSNMTKVTIKKKVGKEPVMEIEEKSSWLKESKKETHKVLLQPGKGNERSEAKMYLPDNVVAYSSGENETLSIPYLKCRLVHYDEYIENIKRGFQNYVEPENSFIYIDSNMSQAVLLANLIFEEFEIIEEDGKVRDGGIKSFEREIGITGLESFRMNISLAGLSHIEISEKIIATYPQVFKKNEKGELVIVQILSKKIEELKLCSTCYFEDENNLALDFFVNNATKEAFRKYFIDSFELFQLFRLLDELNAYAVDDETKEEVYKSKGYYTDWKLPQLIPKDSIFAFTNFFILKKDKSDKPSEKRLLKELSDGEHQFLHTMGICIMLKERRALLSLDEPETHLNPAWRAKFIKILGDSIDSSTPIPKKELKTPSLEIEVLPSINNLDYYVNKDILLTSHSPFIISDCLPSNVVLFDKDDEGNRTAKKASEIGIDTYGTSVNILTNKIFGNINTIGDYALKKLNALKKKHQDNKDKFIKEVNAEFGDSIEKLLAIREVSENK
jgi:restriction system-associated AAA family ATPase